jgi:flagellin
MRINHNISALHTYRQMSQVSSFASKSMEKLSSGLRINRSADDAAGLSISEKMRAQIRGLDQATSNSQNAISLLQTAEGALNETHSVLQRMRELAVQSSNDSNTLNDRKKLQAEMDQLASEISRISNSTEFNNQNLLGGGFDGTFHVGADQGQSIHLSISALDAKSLGVAEDVASVNAIVLDKPPEITGAKVTSGSFFQEGIYTVNFNVDNTVDLLLDDKVISNGEFEYSDLSLAQFITFKSDGNELKLAKGFGAISDHSIDIQIGSNGADISASNNSARLREVQLEDKDTLASGMYTLHFTDGTVVEVKDAIGNVIGAKDFTNDIAPLPYLPFESSFDLVLNNGKKLAFATSFSPEMFDDVSTTFTVTQSDYKSGVSLVGRDADGDGQLDIKASVIKGVDILSQENANKGISTIDLAIEKVSSARSELGAVQNRLEYTINNLNTTSENLTAAQSRIRDVNMAKEMMTFTKNNILSQTAQAMLAQSNQQPQAVLQLLR